MVRYAATPPPVAISSAAPTPRNTSLKCSRRPRRSRYASRMATIMLASMPSRRKITSVASKSSPTQALGQALGKANLIYRSLVLSNPAQAFTVGDGGGLGSARRAQLAEDVGDVDAGRLGGDEQLGADLAVGHAPGEQPQHLELSVGQAGERARAARSVTVPAPVPVV